MKKEPGLGPLLLTFIAIPVIWGANWYFGGTMQDRGTFGDMFGVANSLFTGIALAVIIYGATLQRHEIKLLRNDIERSKSLVEQQQELARSQIKAQEKQIFEATFFQLLSAFSRILTSMDLTEKDEPDVRGADVFSVFIDRIYSKNAWRDPKHRKSTSECFEDFWEVNGNELGHYFRMLYNVFKFIDQSKIEDKKFYSNLVRAQISNDELIIIYLNGLSTRGEKFKPLIEKYSILKHVDQSNELVKTAEGTFAPSAVS